MSDNSGSLYKHVLQAPFTYEGKEYTEMVFDFGKLTGETAQAIETELAGEGIGFVRNEATDGRYQLLTASKASGIPDDALTALPMLDNLRIKNAARRYLVDGDGSVASTLSFDGFTGAQAEMIENELRAEGHTIAYTPVFDTRYSVKLASLASGKTEKEILGLPMNEFLNVKFKVRFFLMGLLV